MNLQSNDFALFGLAPQFDQDSALLDARWKDLQRQAHPDRFSAQGAVAQRLALQWSVRINEAYQRLKDPLKRAAYLCELNGVAVNAENNTAMPVEFLLQQIGLREALDEASSSEDLDRLHQQILALRRDLLESCAQLLDVQRDYLQAVVKVRALMFVQRFSLDLEARLDKMDTADRGQ